MRYKLERAFVIENILGAKIGGKILGIPVILTLVCLISIIFLKVEVINLG
jgi:hypothetical protein